MSRGQMYKKNAYAHKSLLPHYDINNKEDYDQMVYLHIHQNSIGMRHGKAEMGGWEVEFNMPVSKVWMTYVVTVSIL